MLNTVEQEIRQLNIVKWCMLFICTGSAVIHAGFYLVSNEIVIHEFNAREFLNHVSKIPPSARQTFLIVLAAVVVMALDFGLRLLYSGDKHIIWYLTMVLDIVLSFVVVWVLQFNYNGILLWSFTMVLTEHTRSRYLYPTIGIAVVVYAVTYPGVATIGLGDWKTADYVAMYPSGAVPYINLVNNLLNVFSIFFFFLVCVMLIVNKQKQLDQINLLAAELSSANEQLKESNHRLERLMVENARMAEIRERNRIAREVHDTIGHTLTGLAFGIDACEVLADGASKDLKDQLEVLGLVARQGIEDVRTSVAQLKPDSIKGKDAVKAIEDLVEQTRKATRTSIDLCVRLPEGISFDEEEEHAIYRTVQESMTNAIQHGHADSIRISFTKEEDGVRLIIKDNGCGSPDLQEGFGLRHMRERIQMLHGSIRYDGTDGFLVDASVPIRSRG